MGFLILIYGLVLGSFFNLCIYRIPNGISIMKPASNCIKCEEKIKIYDLIPVISYMLLFGRCRNCNESIPIRYVLVEVLTGVLFYITFLLYGISLEFFKFLILESFLIIIALIDFDTMNVYFKTTLPAFFIGLVFIIYRILTGDTFLGYITAAIIAGVSISLIVFTTKGMGEGDIEIAIIMGIFLGVGHTLLALFLAIALAGISAISLIIKNKKSRNDFIAFGPYLSIGSIISILYGDEILNWYLNFL